MIDREHDLSLTRQAAAVGIARSTVYYLPRPVSAADLALMKRIDELHTELPFAGSRMLRRLLAFEGSKVGRRHVKTLMQKMDYFTSTGVADLVGAPVPNTSAAPANN